MEFLGGVIVQWSQTPSRRPECLKSAINDGKAFSFSQHNACRCHIATTPDDIWDLQNVLMKNGTCNGMVLSRATSPEGMKLIIWDLQRVYKQGILYTSNYPWHWVSITYGSVSKCVFSDIYTTAEQIITASKCII